MRIIIEISKNGQIEGVFVACDKISAPIDVEGVYNIDKLIGIALDIVGSESEEP